MQRHIPAVLRAQRDAFEIGTAKRMYRSLSFLMLFAALLIGFTPALHAQFRASLTGTVTDSSGAVVPGATVTLVDTATNYKQTVTSNSAGIYVFNALPPAPYQLTVSMTGF